MTFTPDGCIESAFRGEVRDILDLDPFTRDSAIFDELRRLKKVEKAAREFADYRRQVIAAGWKE